MKREDAATKARRYLGEARLTVDRVDAQGIRATCRGSGALYAVSWSPGEGWACTCEARGRCSHLLALMSVTVRDGAA